MRRLTLLCAVMAGCYAPDVDDCTVECSGPEQCADGQVCGNDHLCAAPDVAGTCNSANLDDSQSVSLSVTIDGHGKIVIPGVGNCDSESPAKGNCTFGVTTGVMRELKAMPDKDRRFASWSSACSGTMPSCALTPVMSLTQVGAKFE